MAKNFLLEPDALVHRLHKRYLNKRLEWLSGGGEWPLRVALGLPTQAEAKQQVSHVMRWQQLWTDWQGAGELQWSDRQWSDLGRQRLPEALILSAPTEVARLLGTADDWDRLTQRFSRLAERWPPLRHVLPTYMSAIGEWSDTDFDCFVSVLDWLMRHPDSGLYLRQLPIGGIDSKWLESRRALVASFLRSLRDTPSDDDFYAWTGLRQPPLTLRLRLLDPQLRGRFAGLGDMQVPVYQLADVSLPLTRVFIVENLQTGLAFTDLTGAAVFMQQGYAVDLFGQLPWLRQLDCYYWGDLDTHGFAILDRLRHYLPHVKSLLMDQETLLTHREWWTAEQKPTTAQLPRLTTDEALVYSRLCIGTYGSSVRLEQERISWDYAWKLIVKEGTEGSKNDPSVPYQKKEAKICTVAIS